MGKIILEAPRQAVVGMEEDPMTGTKQKDFTVRQWAAYYAKSLNDIDPEAQHGYDARTPLTEAQIQVGQYLAIIYGGVKNFNEVLYAKDPGTKQSLLDKLPESNKVSEQVQYPAIIFAGGKKMDRKVGKGVLSIYSTQKNGYIVVNINKLTDEALKYFSTTNKDLKKVYPYFPKVGGRIQQDPYAYQSGIGGVSALGFSFAGSHAFHYLYPEAGLDRRLFNDFLNYREHDQVPENMFKLLTEAYLVENGVLVNGTAKVNGYFNAHSVKALRDRIDAAWNKLPGSMMGIMGIDWRARFQPLKDAVDAIYDKEKCERMMKAEDRQAEREANTQQARENARRRVS